MSRTAAGSIAVVRRSAKQYTYPGQWRSIRRVKLIATLRAVSLTTVRGILWQKIIDVKFLQDPFLTTFSKIAFYKLQIPNILTKRVF